MEREGNTFKMKFKNQLHLFYGSVIDPKMKVKTDQIGVFIFYIIWS